MAVRVTNTTQSPYLIIKNTQSAVFSVVAPEQSKFVKPVQTATLSMIPKADPGLTIYRHKILRTNTREKQNNTFWFLTHKNPVKIGDHATQQTRILRELTELKEKKLNRKDATKPGLRFLQRFDWTETLLEKKEKHAIEDTVVDYHDIFAGKRMQIGMNTESKL